MSPSNRCDEILRLIDEVLGGDVITPTDVAPSMLELPPARRPTVDCRGANASK